MATAGLVESFVTKQKWLDQVSNAVQPVVKQAFAAGGESGKVVKDFLNGVWLGHPLHPVITDVPIGAWTITELLDLASAMQGDDAGLDAASDISLGVGALAAVGAAITGITDWSDADGTHREMGTLHALLNVGGLTLNLASLALRAGGSRGAARVLSALGYMTSATAAYVAGELVYSIGMAVNRNAWTYGPKKYADIAAVEDIKHGEMQHFQVKDKHIVVVQDDDGMHAFGGVCSHFGCWLWQGELNGHVVTCPCHGSQFDVRDGRLVHGPATAPVPSYEIREDGGRVQVRMSQDT